MKPRGARARYSTPEMRDAAMPNVILMTQVGSGLHGISVDDQDDRDEMGICIEPARYVIGPGRFDHYQYRSAADFALHHDLCDTEGGHGIPEGCTGLRIEHVRSGPGDLDRTVYSLRKWMKLALKGNPTVLLPLFAPAAEITDITALGRQLREMAPQIISKQCGEEFLGYLENQRSRFEASDRGDRANRPELIKRYGFDVKYAAHVIRIAVQGQELLSERRIHLPMSPGWVSYLREVRTGGVDKTEVLRMMDVQTGLLRDALAGSRLPECPDEEACWAWTRYAYLDHWEVPRSTLLTVR